MISRSICFVALLCLPTSAFAVQVHRPFILDNGSIEVVLGQGGWRSSIASDQASPGFAILGGGGELVLGIDVIAGIGIVVSGRVLAAPALTGVYLEGLGGLGLQVRLSEWVRLRVGAASGLVRVARTNTSVDSAVLLGGFAAVSIDLFHLGRGRAVVETMLRLDVDGHLRTTSDFPRQSMALALGIGFRL